MRFNPKADISGGRVGDAGGGGGGMGGSGMRIPIPGGTRAGGGIGGLIIIVLIFVRQQLHGQRRWRRVRRPTPGSTPRTRAATRRDSPRTATATPTARPARTPTTTSTAPARRWRSRSSSTGPGPCPSRAAPTSRPAQTITFSGGIDTGCGQATSQVGPFYCPADQQIYLDTTFFADVLEGQLGGQGGDFVEPYVLGPRVRPPHPEPPRHDGPGPHPAGTGVRRGPPRAPGRLLRRHVDPRRQRRRRRSSRASTRATSTRRSTPPRPSVTTGSSSSRGQRVNPEGWTHGSSEQRRALVRDRLSEGTLRGLRHVLGQHALTAAARQQRLDLGGLPLHRADVRRNAGVGVLAGERPLAVRHAAQRPVEAAQRRVDGRDPRPGRGGVSQGGVAQPFDVRREEGVEVLAGRQRPQPEVVTDGPGARASSSRSRSRRRRRDRAGWRASGRRAGAPAGSASRVAQVTLAVAPQVVGDIGQRGAGQRRASRRVARCGRAVRAAVRGPARAGPAGGVRAKRPSARATKSPRVGGLRDADLHHRDALVVLLDAQRRRAAQSGGRGRPGRAARPAAPAPTTRRSASRRARAGRRRPGRSSRLTTTSRPPSIGQPHAVRRRAGAAGQSLPTGLGLPHGADASRCRGSRKAQLARRR